MMPKIYFQYLIGRRRLHKAIHFEKSQHVSVDIPLLLFYFFEPFQIVLFFRVSVCNVIMKTAVGTSSIIIHFRFESKRK